MAIYQIDKIGIWFTLLFILLLKKPQLKITINYFSTYSC